MSKYERAGIIAASGFFDPVWYRAEYPDVALSGMDPLDHYLRFGAVEGRSPSSSFDAAKYLASYPDVAGLDPLLHYLQFGIKENRKIRSAQLGRPCDLLESSGFFDTEWYLQTYPDVAAAPIDPAEHYLRFGADERRAPSPLFDPAYYLSSNPDVASSGYNPLLHYLERGRAEGRRIRTLDQHRKCMMLSHSGLFDADWYLSTYSDVVDGNMDPVEHYLEFGEAEGRYPSLLFDNLLYLRENPDVAAAGINALVHYLESGVLDGRRFHPVAAMNLL